LQHIQILQNLQIAITWFLERPLNCLSRGRLPRSHAQPLEAVQRVAVVGVQREELVEGHLIHGGNGVRGRDSDDGCGGRGRRCRGVEVLHFRQCLYAPVRLDLVAEWRNDKNRRSLTGLMRRLRDALNSFRNDKVAGPDGIKPIMLRHLPEVALILLSRLYAATIELHYTPTLWRKSEIVFIPKPGKTDYSSLRAFRPISLMSFLLKTLERLVQWRLETTAAPYHRNQHVFRTGHCTEHALSHMTDLAEKALLRQHVALAVFLDIEGAFDTLSSKAIGRGMRKHGVEENLTLWYTQYLRHRVHDAVGLLRERASQRPNKNRGHVQKDGPDCAAADGSTNPISISLLNCQRLVTKGNNFIYDETSQSGADPVIALTESWLHEGVLDAEILHYFQDYCLFRCDRK
jgi:hypothetical protein